MNDDIEFVNHGEKLAPFEPIIDAGRYSPQIAPTALRKGSGFSHDERYICSILSAPLSRYLPEKDPREWGEIKEQERAWDVVGERSLNELLDVIRTAKAVNHVRPQSESFDYNYIDTYGFRFIAEQIRMMGEGADDVDRRLEHILVSALLLYEIQYSHGSFTDWMWKHSSDVSKVAEEFSEKGHRDGSAKLHEVAWTMLPQYDSVNHLHERRRDLSAKAAKEWFESLTRDLSGGTFMLRLFQGLRMAQDAGDHRMLWNFHNLHASFLEDDELEVGAGEARVRAAFVELERLRRRVYDLGSNDLNRDAWEKIGSDLQKAHSLFTVGEDFDLAAEAEVLSSKAFMNYAEMS